MNAFSGKAARRWASALAVALVATMQPVQLAEAAGQTRSLKLFFIHTGEKATITFKRNGKFDPKGLQELNRFLRDWRRNEPTRMDPRLFDLVWEVYNKVGATGYINVVSAYRSPATNSMLRSRSAGVAEQSQHMRGKAMDFYIPGVDLKLLRETAVKYQAGGVGFYPTSRSPFVHLDVASVRAWPRLQRQDLARLFPDGKTLHIPADGKPLPGYQQALAEFKARADRPIEIAEAGADKPKRRNLLSFLFGGGDEDEDADAIAAPAETKPAPAAPAAPAAPVMVAEAAPQESPALNAPIPVNRPALAPAPAAPTGTLMTALAPPPGTGNAATALQAVQQEAQPGFTDLASYRIPVPSLLERGASEPLQELAFVPVPSLRPAASAPSVPAPVATPAVAAALPAEPAVETASAVPETRPPVPAPARPQEGFRPSTAVMMGATEPMRAPASLGTQIQPARPAQTPPAVVAEAASAGKASRVATATPPAPVKEEPRTVPVYGFDPGRF